MLEKLSAIEQKYEEITQKLSDPEVISNQKEFQKYAKAHSELEEIMVPYREYKKVVQELADAKEMLEEKLDPEFKEMLHDEIDELTDKQEELENKIKILLIPKDPNDNKNVIVEIRAGTGGDEAALFAGDLFRMYSRFAKSNNWRVELMVAMLPNLVVLKK